jgi:hypothetical protein
LEKNKINQVSRHYDLQLELRYLTPETGVSQAGSGWTVLIGSREVRFWADRPMNPGTKIELAIAWPVLLDGRVKLQLLLTGEVTGGEGPFLIARIHNHLFRTRGTSFGDGGAQAGMPNPAAPFSHTSPGEWTRLRASSAGVTIPVG